MKLEKREITLNEFDSLRDAFYIEKALFLEYREALLRSWRKETRGELLDMLREVAQDMLFLQDLMQGSAIENK